MLEHDIDRLFRKLARGILSRREAVDFAFANLAYKSRLDLSVPVINRLIQEGLGDEVKSWSEWDEGRSGSNYHYMPFNDSRLMIYHFGETEVSTLEQQEELRGELRSRVKDLAAIVRSHLYDITPEP